jgi:predicted RNA-binding Zn-ribbon protein involved in translation (DUF1610 family)
VADVLNQRALKGILAVAVLGLLVGAAWGIRGASRGQFGSSNSSKTMFLCTSCGVELALSSTDITKLEVSDQAAGFKCPKCSALTLYTASQRCRHCRKLIPSTPDMRAQAYVCPHCKKPLGIGQPKADAGGK